MSSLQIQLPFAKTAPVQRWRAWNFAANPFPVSGVATDTSYNDHQRAQIERINEWLAATMDENAVQFAPLLLKGSIGVGKTHVLKQIERLVANTAGAQFPGKVGVSYAVITGRGAKNLLLSSLLLEALSAPLPGGNEEGELPLVHALVEGLREAGLDSLESLPRVSPLRPPIARWLRASAHEQSIIKPLFLSWLMRRDLPRTSLERLGVHGRLEGEGEAVRAYAHVLRLSRRVLAFRVWILLLDQIEDLWRKEEVTSSRRARFLTDLRTLIDEGLEGAPIAPVLAWNTEIPAGSRTSPIEVEQRIESEYRALYSRLPPAIDLPMLPNQAHALAFAKTYVEAALGGEKEQLLRALTEELSTVVERVPVAAQGRVGDRLVQRAWLHALHDWAEEPASDAAPRREARGPAGKFKLR